MVIESWVPHSSLTNDASCFFLFLWDRLLLQLLMLWVLKNNVQFLTFIYEFMTELRKYRYIALLLLAKIILITEGQITPWRLL
jgi:hypothetical protein